MKTFCRIRDQGAPPPAEWTDNGTTPLDELLG
jgi:hypothetical protein